VLVKHLPARTEGQVRYFAFAGLIFPGSVVDKSAKIDRQNEFNRHRAIGSYMGLAPLALIGLAAFGQREQPITAGRPTDWSHHRLIFSDPGALVDAAAAGRASEWSATANSNRYLLQQMRRDPSSRPPSRSGGTIWNGSPPAIHKDWSETLGSGLVNPNTYPAKYSFNTASFSCTSDYVVFPTGTAGSGTTQATIFAYNELYGTTTTGCANPNTPNVYWAYNTAFAFSSNAADASVITTSPVLSLDGIQVAFIQVSSSNVASLVLLKWASGTSVVELNTVSTNVSPAAYRACKAPCMARLTLDLSPNDTWSAPYYDYADDALYVGDNSGKLHQFTGVFLGTPAETGGSYPVTMAGPLASPVYDSTSGYVFVGNTAGTFYSIAASTGVLHATSETLAENTNGIFDGPLVDSTAGKVYVFVGQAAGIAGTGQNCATGDNCVYQFATTFANSTAGLSEPLGTGGASTGQQYLFAGAFDNIYYSSAGGTAGHLYVVGNTGTNAGELYQIPITSAGLMSTPVIFSLTGETEPPYPSPLTEFCNNGTNACVSSGTATTSGTDYLFFSGYDSDPAVCGAGSGCLLALNVSSGTPVLSSVLGESYGTSFKCFSTGGIIVDNAIASATEVGASEIYFLGLGGTTTNLCGATNTPTSGSLLGVQSAQ
jgi:hypothetical protein